MESLNASLVPVQLLARTLVLAEGHGVPRGALLQGLDLPTELRRQLQVDPAPPPARGVDARERVRERLGRHPSAKLPELCQMASQLHVSPRTLKRHLQQQGTSYRRLLDERRALICGGLLRQPGLTLESIAEALGYSTAANFSRAFQRWAGMTPGARRAQLRQEP